MRFGILGSFEVADDDGREIALGGRKQRSVLAILLLHACEVVPSDRLIDELWGERPPATATKTVQVYVSKLRKALGEGVLVTRSGGYALRPRRWRSTRRSSKRWRPRARAHCTRAIFIAPSGYCVRRWGFGEDQPWRISRMSPLHRPRRPGLRNHGWRCWRTASTPISGWGSTPGWSASSKGWSASIRRGSARSAS